MPKPRQDMAGAALPTSNARTGKMPGKSPNGSPPRHTETNPSSLPAASRSPTSPSLAPDKYFELYPKESIPYTPDRPNLWDSLPKTAGVKRYEAFGFN